MQTLLPPRRRKAEATAVAGQTRNELAAADDYNDDVWDDDGDADAYATTEGLLRCYRRRRWKLRQRKTRQGTANENADAESTCCRSDDDEWN